mmetsp:Transcript_15871/g.33728  ORF Transcript_15871/g.33728 Transcript_15871/m.33728 type:complete len:213 (+) Transcript_15871:1619-2257(+)
MEATTTPLSRLASAARERWPACSAPMVGTRPTEAWVNKDARNARHSLIVRTTRGAARRPDEGACELAVVTVVTVVLVVDGEWPDRMLGGVLSMLRVLSVLSVLCVLSVLSILSVLAGPSLLSNLSVLSLLLYLDFEATGVEKVVLRVPLGPAAVIGPSRRVSTSSSAAAMPKVWVSEGKVRAPTATQYSLSAASSIGSRLARRIANFGAFLS